MKRLIALVCVFLCLLGSVPAAAQEAVPYDSYTYDFWGNVVSAPCAYIPTGSITGAELPCGAFNNPKDVFVSADKTIYIADTGNNRIVLLNPDYSFKSIIDSFVGPNGETQTFNKPYGICLSSKNRLYIADRGNERIVVLDEDLSFIGYISNPQSEVLEDGFVFAPLKVSVDYAERIYVVVNNVYQGIMAFDSDYNFMRFFGTIEVTISMAQRFWRMFSTKEQISRQMQFIPTEFTGVDIDENGFVYATNIDPEGTQAVRKLNPKGIDVIGKSTNQNMRLIGELKYRASGDYSGASRIVDVVVRENGIYSIVDANRGRIFTYDSEGNLLYIFGGLGTQTGTFKLPAAIEELDGRLMVLDSQKNVLFLYEPTDYGRLINEAVGLRYCGDEASAVELWKKVLELDTNNEMAYVGIGKAYLSAGDNEQAMYYLKMGMDREYYSIAYRRYRNDILKENLNILMTVLVILIVGLVVFITVKKRRGGETDEYD